MGILNIIREWVRSMFPMKDIQQALDIELAISAEMQRAIEIWSKCYAGNAEWLNENTASLHLEESITREFANTVLNEMTVKANNPKLDQLLQNAIEDMNAELQAGLATGAMIIKPLGPGEGVQFLPQNEFIPIEYDSQKRLKNVIFPEFRKIGDDYYTRLEYHTLGTDGLTIRNTAYRSSVKEFLGNEIPLASVDIWKNLPPITRYPMMRRPAFGYYRNPIKNKIDGSKAGVSIFDSALETICLADRQRSRVDWEYESGERAVHVDYAALKLESDGALCLPENRDRLYRGMDLGDDRLLKEYSPQLRGDGFLTGLDAYKREIEFQVGLSYGDISNPQSVDKTAEEIKASRQRKYNTVTAIQRELKFCLEDLAYAIAFYNSMTGAGTELTITFEDSILTDSADERKQDMQDVSMGAMQLWEYRMKHYGEDEATAKQMVSGSEPDLLEDEDVPVSSPDSAQTQVQGKGLNGAQTQSLIAIMAQYSAGSLSEGQAVNLISAAIGITKDEARKLLNGDVS